MGGLFSFLEQKSTSKALKTWYFAYFQANGEGSIPPPSWLRYWVHSQNQSIILKSTESYSKFHKITKPIPDDGFVRLGEVLSFREILNKFWYFLEIID